jgi:hypothetical protein
MYISKESISSMQERQAFESQKRVASTKACFIGHLMYTNGGKWVPPVLLNFLI